MKKILIIVFLVMVIFQLVAISANLFADGFEGGTTAAWSSETDTENDLTVTEAAALHGTYGLAVLIDNTTSMYLQDNTPTDEARYRARFYLDPNGISMPNASAISILKAQTAAASGCFYVRLVYYTVTGYKLFCSIRNDAGTFVDTATFAITDAPHCVEVDFIAAVNAGSIELIIDGVLKETKGSIDNDTKLIGTVLFGAIETIAANTAGTFYLDDFASNNDGSEIGMISEATDNAIMFGINF